VVEQVKVKADRQEQEQEQEIFEMKATTMLSTPVVNQ
jgi:hypothetical protein